VNYRLIKRSWVRWFAKFASATRATISASN